MQAEDKIDFDLSQASKVTNSRQQKEFRRSTEYQPLGGVAGALLIIQVEPCLDRYIALP